LQKFLEKDKPVGTERIKIRIGLGVLSCVYYKRW